nr:MAG TPA: hypothetical protein [Caudoviricetes sp.]
MRLLLIKFFPYFILIFREFAIYTFHKFSC